MGDRWRFGVRPPRIDQGVGSAHRPGLGSFQVAIGGGPALLPFGPGWISGRAMPGFEGILEPSFLSGLQGKQAPTGRVLPSQALDAGHRGTNA